MNLQEQISRIQEMMNIKDMFKGMFGKKELTSDDKRINMVVDFIKTYHEIKEQDVIHLYSEGDKVYWLKPNNVKIFYYDTKLKELSYSWEFAKEIYNYIPDDRLLELDSRMMADVFEKLYNKKVNTVYGYSSLGLNPF